MVKTQEVNNGNIKEICRENEFIFQYTMPSIVEDRVTRMSLGIFLQTNKQICRVCQYCIKKISQLCSTIAMPKASEILPKY